MRLGKGPKTAFCFHGYGEDASSFSFLERYAGDQFSFIAIDLPFHGQTEWNEGLDFEPADLQQITDQLMNEFDAGSLENGPKTFIGFSLGGRLALALYQLMPEAVERLVLIAPDGLKVNFWYRLATQTSIGRKLFAFTMKRPGWFFGLLQLLNRLKLVNGSIFKFVNYYIGDAEVRRQLYARWVTLRKMKPRIARIRSFIQTNKTATRLIYGRHDRIILPVRGEKFRKGIESCCTISVIHSGHQVLHEKHVQEILPALLH